MINTKTNSWTDSLHRCPLGTLYLWRGHPKERQLHQKTDILHPMAASNGAFHPFIRKGANLPRLRPRLRCLRGFSCRSEEHTSELQSLMRISYAVFCLKKKTKKSTQKEYNNKHTPNEHNSN